MPVKVEQINEYLFSDTVMNITLGAERKSKALKLFTVVAQHFE